eukprot:8567871-Alexandrium_andersonii.AAC.1
MLSGLLSRTAGAVRPPGGRCEHRNVLPKHDVLSDIATAGLRDSRHRLYCGPPSAPRPDSRQRALPVLGDQARAPHPPILHESDLLSPSRLH